MQPNCECKNCGKSIYREKRKINKNGNNYCNADCYHKSKIILRTCPICSKQFPSRKSSKTCSKECGIISIKKSKKEKKKFCNLTIIKDDIKTTRLLKKRLIQHRGTKCERCCMPDTRILVVHHRIRRMDGGSDDLDNLELICPNCHALEHLGEKLKRSKFKHNN